jgi:SagB-type dehydrogenase family enzyme
LLYDQNKEIIESTLLAKKETKTMTEYKREMIRLPEPKHSSGTSIEEALLKRQSVRDFKDKPLTLAEVSQLAWAAQGTSYRDDRRTVPSAGALYPIELFVVAGNVSGLPAGIYRYSPKSHELLSIEKGDKRSDLCNAALGQSSVKRAPAVLVLSGVYERTITKYGDRGIRYVHMEAGHAAQNVCLQAIPMGLGTVVIGAFRDEDVKEILRMADRERPLYVIPVGRR